MSLGYTDFNCICCCKCPWPEIEISISWAFSDSSDSGCEYTASGSGVINKTLTLKKEDCESVNEYNEPNGSGSITVTSGCDNSSGPLTINLVDVNFFWSCETNTGTCVARIYVAAADPDGSPSASEFTLSFDIEGNGAGPFMHSETSGDFSSSASLTINHTP